MDSNLPRLYKDYGQYSNYRNFPLDLDGLKPVERRVLLSAYKIARHKFVKSRKVDSNTTGNYHPHGSCYGSIVQLVKQGFLEGQGNFGSNVGVDPVGPAADRYTECKINPKTIDLAFKYIDHVPWVDTELGDKEPLYLPTMFPLCLMGTEYTQGIGFGYQTYIPCFNLRDLYQRLLWLLGIRKRRPIFAPITDCNIISPPEHLEILLTKGSAKIEVQGIIDVNTRTNSLILKSWPPGRRFEALLSKFSNELDSGMIGFADLSSADTTSIQFQVLRERNRDKIFNEFVEKLKNAIIGFISFRITVIDINKNVMVKSVDKMLMDTFDEFTKVNEQMLTSEILKLKKQINEFAILETIKQPLINCIQKKLSINDTITEITKTTGVSNKEIGELLGRYRISKLVTVVTDATELHKTRKSLKNDLANLKDFVLEQYNGI